MHYHDESRHTSIFKIRLPLVVIYAISDSGSGSLSLFVSFFSLFVSFPFVRVFKGSAPSRLRQRRRAPAGARRRAQGHETATCAARGRGGVWGEPQRVERGEKRGVGVDCGPPPKGHGRSERPEQKVARVFGGGRAQAPLRQVRLPPK